MKKAVLIITAITLTLCTVGFAQDAQQQAAPAPGPGYGRMHHGGGMSGNVDDRLARLATRYNLTEEQKQQIRPILESAAQQSRAIRQERLTADERQAKMRELRQSTHNKIQALLTPEQRTKSGPGPAGWGPGMGRAGRGMGGRMLLDPQKHLAWLDQQVKLTEEQKSKLTPVFEHEKQQADAVLADQSLTSEQRRAKMAEIHNATHQQVMSVLTPEQQQQMGQGRGMRGQGPPQ